MNASTFPYANPLPIPMATRFSGPYRGGGNARLAGKEKDGEVDECRRALLLLIETADWPLWISNDNWRI
jgi:hypothetical protein